MTDDELISIEKKYYDILLAILNRSLGKIITDINSQSRFIGLTTNAKTNPIDSKAENTIENIIANQLHWDVCSLPVSSDSCYSCGDAIVHIDVKTTQNTDIDSPAKLNRMNIEASQTSYVEGKDLNVKTVFSGHGKKPTSANWRPKLKKYEQHTDFGQVPNITYFVRIIYSKKHLVEEISLVCVPNGQLCDIFGGVNILQGGKSKAKKDKNKWNNIRVLLNTISSMPDQKWRNTIIYTRK
ncbi:MAG TPA: hypothetical protein DCL62_06955 [Kandleria vitulina]|nr:hypothetical protein [Kandleria vitulina]